MLMEAAGVKKIRRRGLVAHPARSRLRNKHIVVPGIEATDRAAMPHEFRTNIITKDQWNRCTLCGRKRTSKRHRL